MMKQIRMAATIFAIGICAQLMAAGDIGIPYQKEPRAHLTVGGQPNQAQLEVLKQQGYTTIINLRPAGEFDEFDEAAEVASLGMEYIHIPIENISSITGADANALHEAITNAAGPVLLHCTVGWRAGGLYAIENYLLHNASESEALEMAAEAHMSHAVGDVEDWIQDNSKN